MRLHWLVFVVLPTLGAYRCSLAGADSITNVKESGYETANNGIRTQFLKGSKKTSRAGEERAANFMQKFEQKIPFVKKAKTKINAMLTQDGKLKSGMSVLKNQLIAIAIMAVLAVSGGLIMASFTD